MRLVRYTYQDETTIGIVMQETVYQLEGNPFGVWERGPQVASLADVRLLAPLPVRPSKVVCIGRNYVEHAMEQGEDVPEEPLFFLKPPSAIIGPDAPIVLPIGLSRQVEHEAELALMIGRRCRHVAPADARDVVFGYTCANEVTARDLQRRDDQWSRAKGFDTFCPIGPAIVTDFDPSDVEVICRVNGELRQRGRTRDMVFPIPELIAAVTAVMTLEPGDLLLTGTPEGVGPLRDGDSVEVEIEGIGVLRNPVTT